MNRYLTSVFFLVSLLWNQTVMATDQLTIGLNDAMQLAVTNHAQSQLARSMIEESMANQRLQLASLLPNLSISAYQIRQTVNLRAEGFTSPPSFPGLFPIVIGPFNSFSSSIQLSQKVFDLALWDDLKASQWYTKQSELRAETTYQQVAANAAYAYLNLLRAEQELITAQANLTLAKQLEQLTTDQKNQGIATGVDVVRSQTQTTQARYNLRSKEAQKDDNLTRLKRAIGVNLDTQIQLKDTLKLIATPLPNLQASINQAEAQRPEILASEALINARLNHWQARRDGYLPSVGIQGAIGPSGVTPEINDYHTYSIGVYLSMPLWDGGATSARENQAYSELHQARLQLLDTKEQVDEDVRLSINALATTQDEVTHAEKNLELATKLMSQANDRYKNGVADNLELVDAQTTLSQARSLLDGALASQNIAWINFDLARGSIHYGSTPKGATQHE